MDLKKDQKQQNKLRILEEIVKGEKDIPEGRSMTHAEVIRKVENIEFFIPGVCLDKRREKIS